MQFWIVIPKFVFQESPLIVMNECDLLNKIKKVPIARMTIIRSIHVTSKNNASTFIVA